MGIPTAPQALIIFIKNATLGKVKTRIAKTAGDQRALQIYTALLDHTREIAHSFEGERFLFYSDYIEQEDEWSAEAFKKCLQTGLDLGERMANAFEQVMKLHRPAVIIGSDCPTLTPAIISSAFTHLEKNDFVIGPAEDGGYYLLGMNRFSHYIFQDIAWSSEKVTSQTLRKITVRHQKYHLLPVLPDIDFEEDWEEHGWPLE
ncbi:MAG: glycosyltransferase [Saprospiraceae bacterium]|nr:glycosyltransferase [Saprospiraceae bacterium]